jgi:hypothetical protein
MTAAEVGWSPSRWHTHKRRRRTAVTRRRRGLDYILWIPRAGAGGCGARVDCSFGWASMSLSIGALTLAATLLVVRNSVALMIVLGACTVAGLMITLASPTVTGHCTVAPGLTLLIGASRAWFLADIHRNRPEEREAPDALILAPATETPAGLWLRLFVAAILSSWLLSGVALRPACSLAGRRTRFDRMTSRAPRPGAVRRSHSDCQTPDGSASPQG